MEEWCHIPEETEGPRAAEICGIRRPEVERLIATPIEYEAIDADHLSLQLNSMEKERARHDVEDGTSTPARAIADDTGERWSSLGCKQGGQEKEEQG